VPLEDMAGALHEAAKQGDVDELRQLLAQASPGDVNAGEPKHGYRPLHYGARNAGCSCCSPAEVHRTHSAWMRGLMRIVCTEQLPGTE
jgi:hypothetical protein